MMFKDDLFILDSIVYRLKVDLIQNFEEYYVRREKENLLKLGIIEELRKATIDDLIMISQLRDLE